MSHSSKRRRDVRIGLALLRDQIGLPSITPASTREVLEAEARRPLRGGAADLQHEGLFGDAHKQGRLI